MAKVKVAKPREQLQQELQQVVHGLLSLPNRDLIELTELARICLGLSNNNRTKKDKDDE